MTFAVGCGIIGIVMGLIEVLLDLGCCLLESGNLAGIIIDAVAWRKSRPNRTAIRIGEKSREKSHPASGWTRRFKS